jgi:hypothetical protein
MMEDFYQEFQQREHWADWAMDQHAEFFEGLRAKTMEALTDAHDESVHFEQLYLKERDPALCAQHRANALESKERVAVFANDLVRITNFLRRHRMLR